MTAAQLKASLLDQAIRGNLVAQDPNDEPADALLKRIGKMKMNGEGEKRKGSSRSGRACRPATAAPQPVTDEEKPFDLPAGWTWCRLGEIGKWGSGATPSKSNSEYHRDGTIPWLLTGDLNDAIVTDIPNKITEKALNETSVKLNPVGSVLMAMYGATIGKVAILGVAATTNQACCACAPFECIFNKYLFYFLMSQRESFQKRGEGGAQPNISKEKIVVTPIPLPPLAEQKRIVAKIEELMPLVKRYEAAEQKREKLDGELAANLKASLLDQAIHGKLVPQDPNDEPADALLKRIGKVKMNGEGEKRKGSSRSGRACRPATAAPQPIPDEEKPFDLPAGWEWCRLGEICNYGSCESLEGASVPKDAWLLDLEEIEKDTGRLLARKTASQKESKSSKHVFEKGMVLYSKLRTYLNKVLVAPEAGYCTTEIIPIRFFGGISSEYARLYLMSPMMLEYAASLGYGVKMPRLGTDDARKALFPLPPLAEQKRIVAKIEELMPLVGAAQASTGKVEKAVKR